MLACDANYIAAYAVGRGFSDEFGDDTNKERGCPKT